MATAAPVALGYRTALLDWIACACAGLSEPAAVAATTIAEGLEGRVAALATAGHVHDFDDTYLPGLAHVSAATAPSAVVLGAELGATVGDVLEAFAAGFDAMAGLTAANHPAMRERGWHPTSVCGVVGSATAAARLLGVDPERAVPLALLQGAGLREAFGSDGKSLQVGFAAAAGVRAARLAAAGATAGTDIRKGFEQAYGATWAAPVPAAIDENWIKAYPCCLQTHGAIDCALEPGSLDDYERIEVVVHPVSLTAAALTDVETGLEAKFSIPYLTALVLLKGAPTLETFEAVDPEVRAVARGVAVRTDASLAESEALLFAHGEQLAHVHAAIGAPSNPMTPERHAAKLRSLAGDGVAGLLDDLGRPAEDLLEAIG